MSGGARRVSRETTFHAPVWGKAVNTVLAHPPGQFTVMAGMAKSPATLIHMTN